MKPQNIVCIHSSLRRYSNSQAVLDSVMAMLPDTCRASQIAIGDFPHYCQDLESEAMPSSVADARAQIALADAVIIVTAEYNHGIPGVLKNALDWLSRPVRASCMLAKPVFFLSQSGSALGGVRAQYQLRETLSSMLCEMIPLPEIAITSVGDKISGGRLSDDKTLSFISVQLACFLAAVNQRKG